MSWKDEIAELEAIQFSSMEEAIEALIGKVLKKFEISSAGAEETRQFLEELFANDPELQDELRKILNINPSFA